MFTANRHRQSPSVAASRRQSPPVAASRRQSPPVTASHRPFPLHKHTHTHIQLDRVTAANSAARRHFSSVCYSADGTCVIAGGRSRFVCIYETSQQVPAVVSSIVFECLKEGTTGFSILKFEQNVRTTNTTPLSAHLKVLLKKYQMSHNRARDGVVDLLNSGKLTEAGPMAEFDLEVGWIWVRQIKENREYGTEMF